MGLRALAGENSVLQYFRKDITASFFDILPQYSHSVVTTTLQRSR